MLLEEPRQMSLSDAELFRERTDRHLIKGAFVDQLHGPRDG